MLEYACPEEKQPYVPKRFRPPKHRWIHSILNAMVRSTEPFFNVITTLKVHRKYQPLGFRSARPRRRRRKKVPLVRLHHDSIPAMTTTWANGETPAGRQFDSDSRSLMLDDGASACITNDKGDFIEPPTKVNRKVRGIKGHAKATHRGTVKWHVEDDTGLVHVMMIRGAYLISEAPTRILSPQHLAQQASDHYPKEEGTGPITTSKHITLFWSQRRFTNTVPLDPITNMGLTTTAPGARSFRAFCATMEKPETNQTNIFTTHIIPSDEDDESFQPRNPVEPPVESQQPMVDHTKEPLLTQDDAVITTSQATIIDMEPITHVIPEDPEPKSLEPQDELLRWHYRLGTCLSTALNNWSTTDNSQNACLHVIHPFAPLASMAR